MFYRRFILGGVLSVSEKNNKNVQLYVFRMMKLFLIGTLLILISVFFSGLHISIMLLPTVVLLSTVSGGMIYGLIFFILLTGFSFLLQPIVVSDSIYQIVGLFSVMGLLMGEGIRRGFSSDKVIFLTTFFTVSVVAIFSFAYYRITGIRLTDGLVLEYKTLFETNPELLYQIRDSFDISEEMIIPELLNKMRLFLPIVTFVGLLFTSSINYFLGTFFLNCNVKSQKYPVFTEFYLPGHANFGIGLIFLTGYLFGKIQIDYSYNISVTMVYLAVILLYLQGTASVLYWCRKKFSILFGNMMWILSCVFVPWVIIFIGFFDTMFHLRKPDTGGVK